MKMRLNLIALSILLLCSGTTAFALETFPVVSSLPADGHQGRYVGNREPLARSPLLKLSIGAITPKGWLEKQLKLEADGMAGRLEEISPYLKFEGNGWAEPAGKNGWEEVPYWLRGYGDLGYVLKNQKIIAVTKKWVDAIISTQQPDGWFGPAGLKTALDGKPDMWPHMPVLNAMQSYYEFSGDARVLPFMTRYFNWQNGLDPKLFSGSWQDTRFGDNIESIYWLYNHTGEPWLLELPPKMHENSAKWWKGVASWHNVNFAQGFREPAEYWMQNKEASLLADTERNYQTAMTEYGQFPGGGFAADENARPNYHDPRQGFETCGIVEFMRSFEMLSRISGDPAWLDRCEYIAFNTLPAALTPDEKALRYLTPANIVQADQKNKSPGIENTGPMFAYSPTEAQYHCCIHNHGMGWPLYAEYLWLATNDGGLCASIYNASDVSAKVSDGSAVAISETTDYPFGDTIQFKVKADKPTLFPLYLRVPIWCDNAMVKINGVDAAVGPRPFGFIQINRMWMNGDTLTLTLPMKLRVQRWKQNGDSASVNYGPLSFSLRIGEKRIRYGGTDEWPEENVFASSPWNYGLILNDRDPTQSLHLIRMPGPVADQPFTQETSPIEIHARGKRIEAWTVDRTSLLRPLQNSPVKTDQVAEDITLIPMGAARLRISAFPVIGNDADANIWVQPPVASGPAATATPSASHCFAGDSVDAFNSGQVPQSSSDKSVQRMTFWDHRGSDEWIQYEFKGMPTVSSVGLYWYDDTATHGDCRVPQAWSVFYRDGETWKPVQGAGQFGERLNVPNKTSFTPVKTSSLKIRVKLQPGYSAGVLQWQVN